MAEHDRTHTGRPAQSRALVVTSYRGPLRREERPLSGFLTQLIACERRLPAYRAARTVEPGHAVYRYEEPATAETRHFERLV